MKREQKLFVRNNWKEQKQQDLKRKLSHYFHYLYIYKIGTFMVEKGTTTRNDDWKGRPEAYFIISWLNDWKGTKAARPKTKIISLLPVFVHLQNRNIYGWKGNKNSEWRLRRNKKPKKQEQKRTKWSSPILNWEETFSYHHK